MMLLVHILTLSLVGSAWLCTEQVLLSGADALYPHCVILPFLVYEKPCSCLAAVYLRMKGNSWWPFCKAVIWYAGIAVPQGV